MSIAPSLSNIRFLGQMEDAVRGSVGTGMPYPYFSYEQAVADDSGVEQVYKIGLSRAQMIEWYWRVKTWQVSYDNGEAAGSASWQFQASSEIDLSRGNASSGAFDIPLISYTEDVPDSDLFFQYEWFYGSLEHLLLRDESGFFYPEFRLGEDFGGWPDATVTLTGPTSFTLSPGFVIEAIEWWPYCNLAGEPIWDTQTGEKLRDPATGLLL